MKMMYVQLQEVMKEFLKKKYDTVFATKDYIMWLDADDVILEQDREKLKNLKEGAQSLSFFPANKITVVTKRGRTIAST